MPICIYCGKQISEDLVEGDHIPSKALFPKGKSIENPCKVSSCSECNRGFSKDEEYFRNFLLNVSQSESFVANQLFHTKFKRSIQRRPQIGVKDLEKMELVNLYTAQDIYVGKRTVINISQDDWNRYFRVVNKYVKGLYYFNTQTRLQDKKYEVRSFLLNPSQICSEILATFDWNTDNDTVFVYGTSFVKNVKQAIFVFIFYETVPFISFVASKEDFCKFKQN